MCWPPPAHNGGQPSPTHPGPLSPPTSPDSPPARTQPGIDCVGFLVTIRAFFVEREHLHMRRCQIWSFSPRCSRSIQQCVFAELELKLVPHELSKAQEILCHVSDSEKAWASSSSSNFKFAAHLSSRAAEIVPIWRSKNTTSHCFLRNIREVVFSATTQLPRNTKNRPHDDPPARASYFCLAQVCDWSGAKCTRDNAAVINQATT